MHEFICCQCGTAMTSTQGFMVHTGREHTYKCSYCDKIVNHLGLLKEHMKFKQVSLSGESDDTCEVNDIKKGIEGLKDVLGKDHGDDDFCLFVLWFSCFIAVLGPL